MNGDTNPNLSSARLPRLFAFAGTRSGLLVFAALTLLSGAVMLPALATMAHHGASVLAFEGAAGVDRSREILNQWGSAGKAAMWWQLGFDMPFLVGYGLFLAAADFIQNVSLALLLGGHVEQPWPRISALAAPTTTWLAAAAALFALAGAVATRRRTRARRSG